MKNPYETLDVGRNATDQEIVAAAKAHAKKNHPDAGGNSDRFQEGRRALNILTNPKKREKFDRTGEVDEDAVDNTAAKAMEIIENELAKLTNKYLASGFNSQLDPCRINVVKRLENEIVRLIELNKKARSEGDFFRNFLRKFASRFSRKKKLNPDIAFDFVQARFEHQIKEVDSRLDELEQALVIQEFALKLIRSYDFNAVVDVNMMATSVSANISNAFRDPIITQSQR